MALYRQFEQDKTFSTSNLDNPSPKGSSPSYGSNPVDITSTDLPYDNDSAPPKVSSKHRAKSATKRGLKNSSFKPSKRYTNIPYINIKLSGSILKQIEKKKEKTLYFATIAPLKSDRIHVHCNNLNKLELRYCAGLYMPIDKSFTIHSILSTEFMTAMKKCALQEDSPDYTADVDITGAQILNNNDDDDDDDIIRRPSPQATIKKKQIECKDDEKSQIVNNNNNKDDRDIGDNKDNSSEGVIAYHPKDHEKFGKLRKRVVIYIPGNNYTYDEFSAAETIMNESLAFYCDIPFLVVPFIWPTEGGLLDYDVDKQEEKTLSQHFSTFIKRMWSLFSIIDFVGHGKGCTILLRTLEQLQRDRPEMIKYSHVVCIAPDVVEKKFKKHVRSLTPNIQRMTLYTNTWDWQLWMSKWWNWTSTRAGAAIVYERNLDCIDTTQLLAGWFTGNHWYFTNEYFKNDIKQALSGVGGMAPKYRNYVLPIKSKEGTFYQLSRVPFLKPKPEGDAARRLWNKRLSLIQAAKDKQQISMKQSILNNNENDSDIENEISNGNGNGSLNTKTNYTSYNNVVAHNIRNTANKAKDVARTRLDEAKQKVHLAKQSLDINARRQGYAQLDAGNAEPNVGRYVAPSSFKNVTFENMQRMHANEVEKDITGTLSKIGFMDLLGGDDDDDDYDNNNGINFLQDNNDDILDIESGMSNSLR